MSFPRYGSYQESGVDWLGEVPSHWTVQRLKASIVDCRNGIWGDEPDGGHDDMICLRVADFDRNTFKTRIHEPTYRRVSQKERAGRTLSKGDLLLEKSGGGEKQPVGAVVEYDHDEEAICSNFVARIALAVGMHPRYWAYTHAAAYNVRLTERSVKQTSGIQNLDQSAYFEERAAFPPECEQTAIAAFLDRETAKIDALVEAQRRLIELLKEKRQAVITHAVTKGLDPTAPMKDSGVEWLGEVPAHWELVQLRHLAECCDGQRVPLNSAERAERPGDVPYWGANSIMDYVDVALFDEELVLLGEDGAPFFDKTRSVAFHSRGPIWPNNHVHVLRPRHPDSAGFMTLALNVTDYAQFIDGSTRDKLTQGAMMSIPLPWPTREEREAIRRSVIQSTRQIDALVSSAENSIKLLQERRAALISAAVTGKIDVRGLVPEQAEAA